MELKPFQIIIPDPELTFYVDCPMNQTEQELIECFTCYYYDKSLSNDPEEIVCMYWTHILNSLFDLSSEESKDDF